MEPVFYRKNKNKIFPYLQSELNIDTPQNYIPLYEKLFVLNETNKNSINLNNKWEICKIDENIGDKIYKCTVNDICGNTRKIDIFFKFAPLIDPIKYLMGKYEDIKIESLPYKNNDECVEKMLDKNNLAYIDQFFSYLSSRLLHEYGFIHGIDYYGGYLGIKNNLILNIEDDIDYLMNSSFFHRSREDLFVMSNEVYNDYFNQSARNKSKLKIEGSSKNITLSSIEDITDSCTVSCIEIPDLSPELICEFDITDSSKNTLGSDSKSSCSSRSSLTEEEDEDGNEDKEDEENEEEEEEEEEDTDDEEDEGPVNISINKFPVNVIALEACHDTFDNLIESDISWTETISAFMQIIMTLIVYQKAFNFTHNDLHTNNIMFVETEKQYIYYCYEGVYYKVPTFKRLFKIIDFGRAIYKYNGKIYCSDSFHPKGDAATQYNCEPYLNEKKPRLEPNSSFDLCRLACSLYDNLVDDEEDPNIYNPLRMLMNEWCMDDKNRNILYKKDGEERYPEFKLYKMIARTVHKHIPKDQLNRDIFRNYIVTKKSISKKTKILNVDNIPCMI
tara:strand:+ start:3422 stop:5098 length:1677 start_codon:yes stop_codon:yes gene_type:complete